VKQRIYIDTSIVGGFFDKEFAEPTKALFERLKEKEIRNPRELIDYEN